MKKTLFAAVFTLAALSLKAIDPPENLSELVELYEAHSEWLMERRSIPADDPRLAFHATVANLWWQGRMSNVLAIAEQRLACNSNDIAGLILKMEYDLEFLNLSSVSNSIQRVIDVGGGINSPIYSSNYYRYKFSLEDLLNLFAEPSMYVNVETDRAKSQLPQKRMLFERHLLSVCLDGLVTNYPALPPQSGATAP